MGLRGLGGSSLGLILAICLICPFTNSICDESRHSIPNSEQVFKNVGYRYSNRPWSMVGNIWWRAWSPKFVKTKKWEPVMSLRSITASSWWMPQSSSCLGLQIFRQWTCHLRDQFTWGCPRRGKCQDGGEPHWRRPPQNANSRWAVPKRTSPKRRRCPLRRRPPWGPAPRRAAKRRHRRPFPSSKFVRR